VKGHVDILIHHPQQKRQVSSFGQILVARFHVNPQLVVESIELLVDMKAEIMRLVQSQYGFGTQQSPEIINNNTTLAHALLTNMAFIYRVRLLYSVAIDSPLSLVCTQEPNFGGTPQQPYQHPIIQETINIIWFPNRDGDGIVFYEHFTPIPIKVIALALTLVKIEAHLRHLSVDSNECFLRVSDRVLHQRVD